jgi:hypothetical protein
MICYLCGKALGQSVSRDHVPPQQLWSPEIRREYNVSNLTTLSTHPECNESYKRDEEYAVQFLAGAAYNQSSSARSLMQHRFAKAQRGESLGLHRTFIAALEARPGGLYLPGGKIHARFDGQRMKRVVWKIVRGLWFLEHSTVLPEDTGFLYDVQEPESDKRPEYEDFWTLVRAQPSQGQYQAVFAHKYLKYTEGPSTEGDRCLHGWAMLLWNALIIYCFHFEPGHAAPPWLASPHQT